MWQKEGTHKEIPIWHSFRHPKTPDPPGGLTAACYFPVSKTQSGAQSLGRDVIWLPFIENNLSRYWSALLCAEKLQPLIRNAKTNDQRTLPRVAFLASAICANFLTTTLLASTRPPSPRTGCTPTNTQGYDSFGPIHPRGQDEGD